MDVLELDDPEAGDWLAEYHPLERPAKRPASPEAGGAGSSRKRAPLRAPAPSGRVHLLVGCSIARYSLMDIIGADIIYSKAKGGETWSRLRFTFQDYVDEWRRFAVLFGLSLGSIVIWLSGNDGYERGTGRNLFLTMTASRVAVLERCIAETIALARASSASVTVIGPLPRIAYDITLPWEQTAAYKVDRKVKEAVGEDDFVSVGKALTKKLGRRSRHLVTEECGDWFRDDRIHLSPEGYRKVADVEKFPKWLVLHAAG